MYAYTDVCISRDTQATQTYPDSQNQVYGILQIEKSFALICLLPAPGGLILN